MALREIREDDLELMLQWRNHPSVRSSMFSQSIIEPQQHRLWFLRESKKSDSVWLLFINENDTPSGVVYFTEMDTVSRNAYWGFYAAPSAPSGTGTKMGREALAYYFKNLGFHKLNAKVLESNERSHHFHEKLGFHVEGVLRDNYFGQSGYEDITCFGIIDYEWEKREIAFAGSNRR